MARNATPTLLLGGLVTVALSLGAGFVGGAMSSDGAAIDAAPRVVTESTARARLDELDRRLSSVEERLRVTEERANQALSRFGELDDLRRQIAELRGTRITTPVATTDDEPSEAAAPMTDAERKVREQADLAERRRQLQGVFGNTQAKKLTLILENIADGSPEAAAARRTQTDVDARQLAVQFSLDEDERETVRSILAEEMELAVRDVAPYLTGGLDRADYGVVKEKLVSIWDRRERRMAEVLDEDQFKGYAESQKLFRAVYEKRLDELEDARLNR